MKTLIIILLAFLAITTTVSAQTATMPSKKEVKKTMYACSMHPKEMSTEEGKCSKCGTEMVKVTVLKHNAAVKGSQTSAIVTTKFVCKMDGSTSDKAGKCPKCGMAMNEVKVKPKQ